MKPRSLRLIRYALPQSRGLAVVMLLMLAGVLVDVLKPWPMKLVIDSVLSRQPLPSSVSWITALPGGSSATGLLGWLTVGTLALFLAGWATKVSQSYLQAGIGSRMAYDLGAALFDHLQRLSLRFHGRQPTGDLVKRVTGDSRCVRELVLSVFLPFCASLAALGMMFAVMWRLDPWLSLCALFVAPLIGLSVRLFAEPMEERSFERMEIQGQGLSLAEQTLTALPIVRAFGREEHEDERFSSICRRGELAGLRAVAVQLKFKVSASAVTALGTAVIMAAGGMHVLQGKLSVGDLVVLLSYLASLYSPLETLAYLSEGYASASAGARRVLKVLESGEGVPELPNAVYLSEPAAGKSGHILLEAVTFGYEPAQPVLKGVSLEVRPGEVVALVGPTGAGKSTLVSLIPRFFDPWEGRVLYDGLDVRGIKLSSLRSRISLVLQESYLLPLTVAENIAYGRPGASREEIVAAAVAANADDFIQRLPQAYETVLGERGATLSGGERQRLAIARALLKDAPVLILDEPTSSLDARTEANILEALERLTQGRSAIIIAHRFSTIQRADRIVVLEGGRKVEEGRHLELVKAGDFYARLWQNQFGRPSTDVPPSDGSI